jgi:hypothetical protein
MIGASDEHDTNLVVRSADYTAGAQVASPSCELNSADCDETDLGASVSTFKILARGLPGAPSLEVPLYPQVDTVRSFTRESGMVYYSLSDINGDTVDNWRIEWTEDASFAGTLSSDTTVNEYYNVTGLTMGTTYYIRVIAHHTGGWGTPSDSYPFKPHQQPDAPSNPTLTLATDSTSLVAYARSLTVQWEHPVADNSPDQVANGGDDVTSYLV